MVPIWSRLKSPARAGGRFAVVGGTVAGLALAASQAVLPVTTAEAASTPSCPPTTVSQPFVNWSDSNYYSLVPGGSFESGEAAWTLTGGAKLAPGSETFAVTGKLGSSSLSLPQGAVAQSPFSCIEPNDRTLRLLGRSEGSSSSVRVAVVYQTFIGNIAIPVGAAALSNGWAPTSAYHTGVLIGALLSEGSVHVAIRVTAVSGASRVDDVFIDPRMRR
jgi:hypothetical protein